jgi:hypothetical protein
MKRLVLLAICLVLVGCVFNSGGLRIVEYTPASRSIEGVRGVMRERYIFTHPFQCEVMRLAAEDNEGNVIPTGVTWSLGDPALGALVDVDGEPESIRGFNPAKLGETIVTATNGVDTDTAQIAVYPGMLVGAKPKGLILATGAWTFVESEADIWWPAGDAIRFEAGYFTIPADQAHFPSLTAMEELTADWGAIGAPGDYAYHTDFIQLFLVKARNGAIYSALIGRGDIMYKPVPVVPAP